ncbi:MAG: ATP-binding protein [Pseudomonadota bacterium]
MNHVDALTHEHLRYSILSSFTNAANLAEKISHVCTARPGANPEDAESLRLCLAEALTNIVEHAYGGMEGKPIHADVHIRTNSFEVELIDEGKAMPGGKLPEVSVDFDADDFESLPENGLGWLLIRSEMDDVGYERRDSCNVLRLQKRLS